MSNEEVNDHQAGNSILITTDLARERNREAADRTLMAWILTALALIGFGFGINKVYDYVEIVTTGASLDKIKGAVILGGAFMALGTLSLIGALLQHRISLKRIKSSNYN
jgi:putative membrane protein